MASIDLCLAISVPATATAGVAVMIGSAVSPTEGAGASQRAEFAHGYPEDDGPRRVQFPSAHLGRNPQGKEYQFSPWRRIAFSADTRGARKPGAMADASGYEVLP